MKDKKCHGCDQPLSSELIAAGRKCHNDICARLAFTKHARKIREKVCIPQSDVLYIEDYTPFKGRIGK